jgi:hypothetical protein
MAASSQSDFSLQPNLQSYGWQAFCVEFLCGIIVVMWYLLYLAEKTTLRGLNRLETFATSRPDSPSGYERVTNILFQDEGF